jgi:hypothetical protein
MRISREEQLENMLDAGDTLIRCLEDDKRKLFDKICEQAEEIDELKSRLERLEK